MSATSPSPASSTTPPPPPSSSDSSAPQSPPSTTTTTSPQPSSSPSDTSTSPPPSPPNADPPTPPTLSKPPTPSSQSPPPATQSAPPPASPPPPATLSPSPSRPPPSSPAIPPLPSEEVSPASPPPPSNARPPSSPPPPPPPPNAPPPPPPTTNSSPPPPSNQPTPSPPKSLANNSSPPAPSPLQNSPRPTPAAVPPSGNSPPPPSSAAPPSRNSSPPTPSAAPPPKKSPPTPSAAPPQRNSPPPPASVPPPRNSPPPPAAVPPQSSSPPLSTPSRNSPPPPQSTPPSSPPPPPPRKVLSPPAPQPTPSASKSSSKSSPLPATRLAPHSSTPSLPPPPNSQIPATAPSENGTESSNPSGNANGSIGTGGIVAISLVAGILVLALVGIAIWCMRRQKKRPPCKGGYVLPSGPDSPSASDSSFFKTPSSAPVKSGSGSDYMYTPSDPGGLGNSRSWFTYEELVKATNGFSTQNLLGEGGFGSVYKGCLPDGREIAVKQLKIGGGQGEREFKAEVETISRIHHRHLVSLVGYCIQDSRRLLVYDYAPNDTLYFHLHGEGRPVLDWAKRVRIAVGAARGLAYLHEDCNPRIIHRDIKSSNILLDYNFEARVSDFGLARLALDAYSHVTTRVMGTFGYLAPEYASSGKLTEKSDVFSFGVVLLELITGRKPVDMSQPMGDESLVEWARPLLSEALVNEEFDKLTDPRLENNYVESEMFRLVEIAAACVRHSATKRPNMGQVVRAFDSLATSDLTNGMRPGESEAFDSALQSEEIQLFRQMAFGFQDYSTDFFSLRNSNT